MGAKMGMNATLAIAGERGRFAAAVAARVLPLR
jgi:hypothetical protein